MTSRHARIWVGVDAGKGHHWAVAVDTDGETVFSTKVLNDEAQILTLVDTARERAVEVRWALDIAGRAFAPLLALLIAHGQRVVYVPGRTVNRMSGADGGEGRAVEASQSQMTALPRETPAAKLVRDLAHQLLALNERIKDDDREIRESFRTDERAEIVKSLPGMGPILGAEFVAIAGDLSSYRDAGRLVSHATLAPVPRDSDRRTGNHHLPKRYERRLR